MADVYIDEQESKLRQELEQFEESSLAGQATVALGQVLLALPKTEYTGPREEAGPALQLAAQRVIGFRMFRTVRAATAVLSIGYEPEARALDRLTHRAHIIDTGTESWRFRHGLTRTSKKAEPHHAARSAGVALRRRPPGDGSTRPPSGLSGTIWPTHQQARSGATSSRRAGANRSRRSQTVRRHSRRGPAPGVR